MKRKKLLPFTAALFLAVTASSYVSAGSGMNFRDTVETFLGLNQIHISDINGDGKQNIVDIILLKERLINETDHSLNAVADNIRDEALVLLNDYMLTENEAIRVLTETSDEDFVKALNSVIDEKYGYKDIRWTILLFGKIQPRVSVICTSSGTQTGASPNHVPAESDIPYSPELVYLARSGDSKWDNAVMNTAKLNGAAKNIYRMLTLGENMFKLKPDEGVNSSDINSYYSNFANCFITSYDGIVNWTFYVEDGCVRGVICTDSTGLRTGAYPNTVPLNLDIPFSESNHEHASDMAYDWKSEYADCISADPESASLGDYHEFSADDARVLCAWQIYCLNTALESEYIDIHFDDGEHDTLDDDTVEELRHLYSYDFTMFFFMDKGEHFKFTTSDNKVVYTEYINDNNGLTVSLDADEAEPIVNSTYFIIDGASLGAGTEIVWKEDEGISMFADSDTGKDNKFPGVIT